MDTAVANGSSPPAVHDAGFAAAMRGTEPRRADIEFPALVQDLYAVADERRAQRPLPPEPALPGGWRRIDDADLRASGIDPALLRSDRNGFDAGFYRGTDGQVALVMAGTNEGQDWTHNLRQGLGLTSTQYDQAFEVARKARVAFGDDLVLTGHSLGGGLAAASAMVTDTPAVTFNAAGVHNRTLAREGLDPSAAKDYAAEGLVRSYTVRNELLTHLQEDAFLLNHAMPDAAGHQIQLPDPDPLSFGQRLIPGKMLLHRLDLHYIDAVVDAQAKAGLHDRFAATPSAAAPDARSLGLSEERVAQWTAQVEQHRQAFERADSVAPGQDPALAGAAR